MYSNQLMDLFSRLNAEQRQVVDVGSGLCCVVAVPGAGKTLTLVARIARLVADGLDPKYILAMTFTRAAAAEMEARLKALGIAGARVGTIHSLCRQILAESRHGLLDSVDLDEKGIMRYELKKILWDLRNKRRLNLWAVNLEGVERYISACKAEGITYLSNNPLGLNFYCDIYVYRKAMEYTTKAGVRPQLLKDIYYELEDRRAASGLFDYDDMLAWAWMLLLSDRAELAKWRSRYAAVLVDECQDSSPVQWDIARFLCGLDSCVVKAEDVDSAPVTDNESHNLMVISDPAQSIFGWRSAKPKQFIDFYNRPDVKKIILPLNYRSNVQVCDLGTKLIKDYKWNLAGTITPYNKTEVTDKIKLITYDTIEHEAEHTIHKCRELAAGDGLGFRSCAVLARMKVSLDLAEIECIRKRIRYIKMASGSFFESKETQDILAYLRVAGGFDPGGYWMQHLINRPFRFISTAFVRQAVEHAKNTSEPLLSVMLDTLGSKLATRQRNALVKLKTLLNAIHADAVRAEEAAVKIGSSDTKAGTEAADAADLEDEGETISRALSGPAHGISLMLRDTRYLEAIKSENGLNKYDDSKEVAIEALRRIAAQFTSYGQFLGYVDQIINAVKAAKKTGLKYTAGTQVDALTLATTHACKGLEFKHVFIIDVSDGIFPSARSDDLDEELRLFYVACTRAKDTCTISHSGGSSSASQFFKRAKTLLGK